MNNERNTAIITEILYITGTVTVILSVVFSSPALGSFTQHSPDCLTLASADPHLIAGSLFLMAMRLSLVTAGILSFYSVIQPLSTIHSILVFPMGIQKMVMAVWLIVKGFNSDAVQKLVNK